MLKQPQIIKCSACARFERLEAVAPPNSWLAFRGVITKPGGKVELYECRACGVHWQRFVPTTAVGDSSRLWERQAK